MIRLSDNLEVNKPAPVDDRLGVFSSTASALAYIAEDRRYIGLTLIVDTGSGATEYWFENGVTNGDLVAKSGGGGFNCADLLNCTDFTDLQTDVSNLQTDILDLVPYTGATQNVDLGTYNLTADQLNLNVTPTGTLAVGGTQWNNTIGSSETLLKGGSVTLKNGVDLVARVVNKVNPNTTLTKASYQVVKVAGAQGQRLAVELARANNDLNSADTLGMVIETIAPNQEGFILTVGQIENINTTGSLQGETWTDGDVLYLSPTTAGRITNVKPNGLTGHIVVIGYVEYAHANNGKIYVKIMNGWELAELHDVYIDPATLANRDALMYDSSVSLWKNRPIESSDLPTLTAYPRVYFANSSASASVTTLAKIFEGSPINITDMRVGTTFICTGFYTGSASSAKGFGLSSNNTSPTLSTGTFTSGQFYFVARYIGGANGTLRISRVGGNGFGVSTTTAYVDINASSGTHTLSFWGSSASGTIIVEHCLIQIIY
jgi:hypothetical protein